MLKQHLLLQQITLGSHLLQLLLELSDLHNTWTSGQPFDIAALNTILRQQSWITSSVLMQVVSTGTCEGQWETWRSSSNSWQQPTVMQSL